MYICYYNLTGRYNQTRYSTRANIVKPFEPTISVAVRISSYQTHRLYMGEKKHFRHMLSVRAPYLPCVIIYCRVCFRFRHLNSKYYCDWTEPNRSRPILNKWYHCNVIHYYYYYLPHDDEKKTRPIHIIRVYNTIYLGIVCVKEPYLYFLFK